MDDATVERAAHRSAEPAAERAASGTTTAPGHAVVAPIFAAQGLHRFVPLVRERVSPARYGHIRRVAELAAAIAHANGFSAKERAQVVEAALLHDAARDLTDAELLTLAPPRLELERSHPLALHGRAARALAVRWGVTDEVVLDAIDGHVFGVPLSDRVGMALYVADVCEPGRGVNADIRELAMHDLTAAYRRAVCAKVDYLKRAGKEIHPGTLATHRAIVAGATDTVITAAEERA